MRLLFLAWLSSLLCPSQPAAYFVINMKDKKLTPEQLERIRIEKEAFYDQEEPFEVVSRSHSQYWEMMPGVVLWDSNGFRDPVYYKENDQDFPIGLNIDLMYDYILHKTTARYRS